MISCCCLLQRLSGVNRGGAPSPSEEIGEGLKEQAQGALGRGGVGGSSPEGGVVLLHVVQFVAYAFCTRG